MISSGVTGATASVISSTSATNSPYSTNKSSSGTASTVTGTAHVAFSDSVGGDAANNSVAPLGESGERYNRNTIEIQDVLMHAYFFNVALYDGKNCFLHSITEY